MLNAALSVGTVILVALIAWFGARFFTRVENALRGLAGNRRAAILIAGVTPLVIRLALLPVLPIPIPQSHDEFSYLLAADTFAHGRLANPPHPLAIHFETMHVLMRPTYVSIYPPAQGLAMAFGQVLFGYPWVGVCLSVGLMCAAACWMLQGWMPPAWALFGALLFGLRLGILSYWMNSYWGGAVAATGGMLVLGALPRMLRERSAGAAFWMGLGIAILANSRPFEGLVFTVLVVVLLCWKAKRVPVLWPAALVLVLAAGCMALYFQRTTGNPLQMPYTLYRQAVTVAPHFVFQGPRPEPAWNHDVLRDFYISELDDYTIARERPYHAAMLKLLAWWRFILGVILTLPAIAFCFWASGLEKGVWIILALFLTLAILPQVWFNPHYSAPATGLAVIAVTGGLRRIHLQSPWLVRAIALAVCATLVVGTWSRTPDAPGSRWTGWGRGPTGFSRVSLAAQLNAVGGSHLVLVRYSWHHNVHEEWVYNGADIDKSKIVWARDLGPFRDTELLRYFRGRRVWLVEPDRTPARVVEYPAELIGDAERLKRLMLGEASGEMLSCDHWNYLFGKVTGLEAGDAGNGCGAAGGREGLYSIGQWNAWMAEHSGVH